MSTTPIIIETIMPLGQIQAGQQALRDLGLQLGTGKPGHGLAI